MFRVYRRRRIMFHHRDIVDVLIDDSMLGQVRSSSCLLCHHWEASVVVSSLEEGTTVELFD
jgi:hypothetical protein